MTRITQTEPIEDKPLTIGTMCKVFNVTPRTLRFYEAKELLFPIRDGQKRLFPRREQVRLRLILRGKRFGFSLEDIRQLLNMYDREDRGTAQLLETYTRAGERLAEMKVQYQELAEAIEDLGRQLEWGADELRRRGVDLDQDPS